MYTMQDFPNIETHTKVISIITYDSLEVCVSVFIYREVGGFALCVFKLTPAALIFYLIAAFLIKEH